MLKIVQRQDKPFFPHDVQKCIVIKFWRPGRPFPALVNSVAIYQLLRADSMGDIGRVMTWVVWVHKILAWAEILVWVAWVKKRRGLKFWCEPKRWSWFKFLEI